MNYQTIVEKLFEFKFVTHTDLNDTQIGCVRINSLQELIEVLQVAEDSIKAEGLKALVHSDNDSSFLWKEMRKEGRCKDCISCAEDIIDVQIEKLERL